MAFLIIRFAGSPKTHRDPLANQQRDSEEASSVWPSCRLGNQLEQSNKAGHVHRVCKTYTTLKVTYTSLWRLTTLMKRSRESCTLRGLRFTLHRMRNSTRHLERRMLFVSVRSLETFTSTRSRCHFISIYFVTLYFFLLFLPLPPPP